MLATPHGVGGGAVETKSHTSGNTHAYLPNWYVTIEIRAGKLKILRSPRGFQCRHGNTIKLLKACVAEYEVPDVDAVHIITDDFCAASEEPPLPSLRYAVRRDEQPGVIGVPDFLFWNWPETGVEDLDEATAKIAEAGKAPPKDPRAGWIGNCSMHPTREALKQLGDTHSAVLDVRDCGRWEPKKGDTTSERNDRMWAPTGAAFLSFEEMAAQWAYLIEVEGRGYSARLKVLLWSRRPVLLQDREWCEYWHHKLIPWVHFIPVARDLSDLVERVEWARGHPDEAAKIAEQALEFARANLTRGAAIQRLSEALQEAALWQRRGS